MFNDAGVKGINIFTKSTDPLGRLLTNPNWGLSAEDKKRIFDVETPYKKGKTGNLIKDKALMKSLMIKKFQQSPELIEQINKRGGVSFLQASKHITGRTDRWTGKGTKSNFIKTLIEAYEETKAKLGGVTTGGAKITPLTVHRMTPAGYSAYKKRKVGLKLAEMDLEGVKSETVISSGKKKPTGTLGKNWTRGHGIQNLVSLEHEVGRLAKSIKAGTPLTAAQIQMLSENLGQLQGAVRGNPTQEFNKLRWSKELNKFIEVPSKQMGNAPYSGFQHADKTGKPVKRIRLVPSFYKDLKVVSDALETAVPERVGLAQVDDKARRVLDKAKSDMRSILNPKAQFIKDPHGAPTVGPKYEKGTKKIKLDKYGNPMVARPTRVFSPTQQLESQTKKGTFKAMMTPGVSAPLDDAAKYQMWLAERAPNKAERGFTVSKREPVKGSGNFASTRSVQPTGGASRSGIILGEAGHNLPTRDLIRNVQGPHPLLSGETMTSKQVVGQVPSTLSRPNLFDPSTGQTSVPKTQAEKTARMGSGLETRHAALGQRMQSMGIETTEATSKSVRQTKPTTRLAPGPGTYQLESIGNLQERAKSISGKARNNLKSLLKKVGKGGPAARMAIPLLLAMGLFGMMGNNQGMRNAA